MIRAVIVDCAAYVDGCRVDVDHDLEHLASWSARAGVDHGFVWLGLRMPNQDELSTACAVLELDVAIAEVLAPHKRPVLSIDDPTTQVVLRTARYDDATETIMLGEMTVLVGAHAIVSVRHGQASALAEVRARLERDPERLTLGPTAVLAAIIAHVIAGYRPAIDGFEIDAIEAEREVFSVTRHQPVRRVYALKRQVRELLVAIDSLQDPLARLIRQLGPRMATEVVADLSEAADELDRAVTRAQSLSNLLDAALTASLAQISVQQNEDMRKISAWVAMAAVPTLIAGIYGMNFASMPELGWAIGYPMAIGMMALIAFLMYRGFRKGGWF